MVYPARFVRKRSYIPLKEIGILNKGRAVFRSIKGGVVVDEIGELSR